ncbi:hypothetical protein [Pseudomonas syringae]
MASLDSKARYPTRYWRDTFTKGGAAYDIDNLVIMTPRQNMKHHRNHSQ